MSDNSGTPRVSVILAILSVGFLTSASIVRADIPSTAAVSGNSQSNSQAQKLLADAQQALKKGDLPLATIELKNALRLAPDSSELHTQLGLVLLQSGQTVPAEQALRQARTEGAKDQDVVPALLQCMSINNEWKDLLGQFPDPVPGDKGSLAASTLAARALAFLSMGDNANAIASMDRSLAIRRDVTGLMTRAQIAIAQSKTSDALTYANQALALSPNYPNALLLKAQLISITDKNAALAIVDGVIKEHPSAMNAVMARIVLLLSMGKSDEAQKSVDSVLSKYPNALFATFYKAILLGMHNKALDGWRIAQSLPTEFTQSEPRYAIGAAQLAAMSGNTESANSILMTYVAQHPTVVDTRLELAALHLKIKTLGDPLNDLQPLMQSQDPKVLEFIASTYAALKRPEDSVTYLRKANAAGSQNTGLKFQLAMIDLRQGSTSQGVQEMLDGIRMQPGNLSAPEGGIDLLVRQAKFVEAQALADQVEKGNPKSPAPPFFKGEILLAQGKKDESLVAINQSLQRDPHYLPALYARTQIYIAQNRYADAIKDWKQLQIQQPNNPLPYVKLAEIAALSKQPTQSIALLNQAISKDPKLIATRIILAQYQVSLKQYADAQTTLKAALQVSPNNPQVLALSGQLEQLMGQKSAAVGTNKVLVQKYQQSGAAQFLLANSLYQNGDKKGAIAAMKRATELSPDVIQYRTSLINLQIQSGDNAGATATAHDFGSNHKGPDADIMLAETLARLKRFPEAASVLVAAEKNDSDFRLQILDSQIAMDSGNRARAISVLKDWLTDHTSDLPVRMAYASVLLHTNDNSGALAQYEIILKSRDNIPEVLNNAAWLLKDSDSGRALTLVSKAAQLQPNSSDISDTLGLVLMKKGDAKGALPVLQRAHAIAPTNGEISYHLALALNALGQKSEAKQAIQAALAKDQTFLDAAEAKKLLQKL